MQQTDIELLKTLLSVASPSGDESTMAEFLTNWVADNLVERDMEADFASNELWPHDEVINLFMPGQASVSTLPQVVRLRDCLVVTKGDSPQVAVFAHIDTCGFTVGYGNPAELIPIGGPVFTEGKSVKIVNRGSTEIGTLSKNGDSWTITGMDSEPGDRLIYAADPAFNDQIVVSPYLDNRAGIWAALHILQTCENVCICFTTGEETGGSGAIICAKYVYENLGITKALICDITWDTEHVHCGDGVAISRRDRWVPSQFYVDQLIGLASSSGIKHQIEIESDGGSDGGGIERSGAPINWAFIGAPEKLPHSSIEELNLSDLEAMGQLLSYLVDKLSAD